MTSQVLSSTPAITRGLVTPAILREALRDWLDRNETTTGPEGEPR